MHITITQPIYIIKRKNSNHACGGKQTTHIGHNPLRQVRLPPPDIPPPPHTHTHNIVIIVIIIIIVVQLCPPQTVHISLRYIEYIIYDGRTHLPPYQTHIEYMRGLAWPDAVCVASWSEAAHIPRGSLPTSASGHVSRGFSRQPSLQFIVWT